MSPRLVRRCKLTAAAVEAKNDSKQAVCSVPQDLVRVGWIAATIRLCVRLDRVEAGVKPITGLVYDDQGALKLHRRVQAPHGMAAFPKEACTRVYRVAPTLDLDPDR